MDWTTQLLEQLTFHWEHQARPRLNGLGDEEYLWEPVPDAWSVRRNDAGNWTMDRGSPQPTPNPVTTIAWRMMHIAATGLANRANAFFGDDPTPDLDMNDPKRSPASMPSTAADAVAYLEQAYGAWLSGISSLDEDGMRRPLGPKGGMYAQDTMADLIVHINREVMHHGGEIGVLRDLYRAEHRAEHRTEHRAGRQP